MAYLNYTGAEAGDLSEVYASGGTTPATVSSSSPKSGAYSYLFSHQDDYARFGMLGADGAQAAFSKVFWTDPISVGFWWKAPSAGDLVAATYVVSIQDTSNVNLWGLAYNTVGTLKQNNGTTPGTGQFGSTFTPTAGTWYYIELIHDGAGFNFDFYVNGTRISTSAFSLSGTACWVQFGYASGATNAYGTGSNDPKWDDLYISTDSGASKYNSANPPIVGVSKPRAAGALAQWTGGTGSTFAEVDEAPNNGDTDYIKDATSGNVSSFAMQSTTTMGITGATITAVKTVAIVRDEAGGAESVKVRLRNGSTNRDTTGADPGSSYVALARLDETDPNTSAAWTTGGFDTIEGGVVNNASVAVRCTAIYAMVLYTPVVLGFIFPNRRQSVAVQRAAYW